MATGPLRYRAILNLTVLDSSDAERDDFVNGVNQVLPQSAIYKNNPAVQSAFANVLSTLGTYKTATKTASGSAQQAKADANAAQTAKKANDKAIVFFVDVVENDAQSPEDLAATGLKSYPGKPPAPPMLPPETIDTKPGRKGSGVTTATVREPAGVRRRYAAQMSLDGNTWTALPGSGKSRKLTGKSGGTAWVRFALMRGQAQSDWSSAVPVTFP